MKRATIATLATVAGVALLGGGAYAVTQIPGGEPTASATTEPGVIESPTATPEPDEAPTPAESATPAPVETQPAVEYTEVESEFLFYADQAVRGFGEEATDAELLEAGYATCAAIAAGEEPFGLKPFPDAGDGVNGGFVTVSQDYLCD